MRNIHVVFGPTGSGKTKLAHRLAVTLNAPMVSFDSRKSYKELNVGTNKYELFNFNNVTILGTDLFTPGEEISTYRYRERLSRQFMANNLNLAKNIIFWGGTGLYLDSLLFGLPLGNAKTHEREKFDEVSLPDLQKMAIKINQTGFETLTISDKQNPRRLIRLIERSQPSIDKGTTQEEDFIHNLFQNASITVYLAQIDRNNLYARINERLSEYIAAGWLTEIESLIEKYGKDCPALKVMGYKEMYEYLQGERTPETLEKALDKVRQAHRRYAKRQLTWTTRYFKPIENVYPNRRTSPKSIEIKYYELGGKILTQPYEFLFNVSR